MGLGSRDSWEAAAPTGDRPPLSLVRDESDDRVVVTRLRQTLEAALDGREDIVQRLSHADTTVTFRVADGTEVTLHCGAPVVRVVDGPEVGEVVLELSEEQALELCAAALCIPTAVATGSIRFDGPVRRFLTVASILRTLIAATHVHGRPAL